MDGQIVFTEMRLKFRRGGEKIGENLRAFSFKGVTVAPGFVGNAFILLYWVQRCGFHREIP